ncbi:MAG TPA: thiamine diphosphokinase [Candidatus Limnocylindria bacterium]|jgi:thiamine pyrophosphokinase|nr:thiamine diphosphokinase [Candidatus Limnocylindria bacterium]
MKAVVVAHGDVLPSDRAAIDGTSFIVAADGGALALERWKILPHLVVGDMDSLGKAGVERLAKQGIAVESHPVEKNESDLELAIARAVESGAKDVIVIGALGGERLDHETANLLLLADPGYLGVRIEARRGALRIRPLRGPGSLVLAGPVGALVTLLPVGGNAEGVTTEGLRYPLNGGALRFGRTRGLSNEVVALPARVSLERGSLLVFEAPQGGG